MQEDHENISSYVKGFEPVKERLPLVHVMPSVSLDELLSSGKIQPTANSRANGITKDLRGKLYWHDGKPVDDSTASRLAGTDIDAELHTPMVHFSLGVPYYRPSFSQTKRGMAPFHSCALIFDADDVKPDYIYANDSGSLIMNFHNGQQVPRSVNLEGMKLDNIEDAHRYVKAFFGNINNYLHGTTNLGPPQGKNPYAHFVHNTIANPKSRPEDAKEAAVTVEVKTKEPVDLNKLKGIVMPAAMVLNPRIEKFLIDHPKVRFRLYTTSPWIGPEECHAAVLNETYKIYIDSGIVKNVATEKSHFSDIGDAVTRIREARKRNEGSQHGQQ